MKREGNSQDWSIFTGLKQVQKKIWSLGTSSSQRECRFPLSSLVRFFSDPHNKNKDKTK
jgi:hypothetical protein